MDLQGRACIVTGSTKGIGFAVADSLVRAGAHVVVNSRSAPDVERVSEELNSLNEGRVTGIAADVSKAEDCVRLVESSVGELGRLDVLVNNAGVGIFASIEDLSVDEWQTQLDTNLLGVFACSKAGVPHLKATKGWIINVGSLACRNPFAGGTGYNASKFGLLGMTEAMMLDLRQSGIRVSIIMPGSVNTYFAGQEMVSDRAWALGPGDVASATLHLLTYRDDAHVSRVEMRPSRPPAR